MRISNPLFIVNSIRRGLTPEVNAVATVVFCSSLVLLFSAQFLLRRGAKPKIKTA